LTRDEIVRLYCAMVEAGTLNVRVSKDVLLKRFAKQALIMKRVLAEAEAGGAQTNGD
jgi:hypothetical protein